MQRTRARATEAKQDQKERRAGFEEKPLKGGAGAPISSSPLRKGLVLRANERATRNKVALFAATLMMASLPSYHKKMIYAFVKSGAWFQKKNRSEITASLIAQ